jgi:hypothetical protein
LLPVMLMFMPLLILYWLAAVTQIIEIQGYLMYALIVIALFSLIGGRALVLVAFPLFYLLFALPPPDSIVAAVTQPLKIMISTSAIELLYALGYPIAGAGVTIQPVRG